MTQNPQTEIKNPKSADPKLKILLVEDNRDFVCLLREELAEAGGAVLNWNTPDGSRKHAIVSREKTSR